MRKTVITGVTGLRNRGVEALVTTTVEQLEAQQPKMSIDILTETPDYDRAFLNRESVRTIDAKRRRLVDRLRARGSKLNKSFAPEYSLFRDASVAIASGGDLFTSDYPGALQAHLRPLELALHANVPVVFLGQSIAFKSSADADVWLRVAQQASLITVRESISYDYVTQDLGLSPDLVVQTADSAFLLSPLNRLNVNRLMQSYGIALNRPVVAIAPSQGISHFADCDQQRHLDAWHQVIDTILNELGAEVLVIPHAQNNEAHNDDRVIASQLHRQFDFDPRIHVAGGEHSAAEFKGLIGACDLLIAERMHAAIAGLSSEVCTVVVGYSVKARGIMGDLYGADSIPDSLLIPVQEFMDADRTCNAIRQAWTERAEMSNQLATALPAMKAKAKRNFDLLATVMA